MSFRSMEALASLATLRFFVLVALLLVLLSGCSSVDVEEYSGNQPRLSVEEFFNGELTAHGVLKDRSGKVTRYFNASITAQWQDGIGTLDEQFLFDDGEQQQRIWTLEKLATGRYLGNAGDVIGPAEIKVAGNAMFLQYVLRVPYGDGTIDVTIDDRMYLVSDDVLINESTLYKFGFRVGELVLVISKR